MDNFNVVVRVDDYENNSIKFVTVTFGSVIRKLTKIHNNKSGDVVVSIGTKNEEQMKMLRCVLGFSRLHIRGMYYPITFRWKKDFPSWIKYYCYVYR